MVMLSSFSVPQTQSGTVDHFAQSASRYAIVPESQNSASVLLTKIRKSLSILGLSNSGDSDLHVLMNRY